MPWICAKPSTVISDFLVEMSRDEEISRPIFDKLFFPKRIIHKDSKFEES